MSRAKVFKSGNSQAVRLPKDFHIDTDEVHIRKVGNMIILTPESDGWDDFEKSLDMFDDSFMCNRNQPEIQKRDDF